MICTAHCYCHGCKTNAVGWALLYSFCKGVMSSLLSSLFFLSFLAAHCLCQLGPGCCQGNTPSASTVQHEAAHLPLTTRQLANMVDSGKWAKRHSEGKGIRTNCVRKLKMGRRAGEVWLKSHVLQLIVCFLKIQKANTPKKKHTKTEL